MHLLNLNPDESTITSVPPYEKAYLFPGQGSQFVGMGKELYEQHALAKRLFDEANEILGFRITDIMFSGTDEDLETNQGHSAGHLPIRSFMRFAWAMNSSRIW